MLPARLLTAAAAFSVLVALGAPGVPHGAAAAVADFPGPLAAGAAMTQAPERPPFDVAPLVKPVAAKALTALASTVHGFDARHSQVIEADTTPTAEFFRNADGSGTAMISSVPVRFKGNDGAWHGIDPTLVTDVDGSLRPRSVQALSRIQLDQGDPAVTASTAAGDIEVRHVGLAADLLKPLLSQVTKGVRAGSVAALAKVDRTQASIAVTGGAQVRYDMGAYGFTDDIVLPSASSGSSFRVMMHLPKGLHASERGNGVVLTDAAGNLVASYVGGVAYDAVAAAASPDGMSAPAGTTTPATVALVSQAAQTVIVNVSIDPAWLTDPQRAFPVVIDPTFNNGTATSTTGTEDTYVSSDCAACTVVGGTGPNAGTNYNALHFLREGALTKAGSARPMIPFFDMQSYNPPVGWSWTVASSSNAQLHLYSTAYASCDLPTDVNVIEKPWNPYTFTWNGLPPVTWNWVQQQNQQGAFLSAKTPDGTQDTTTGVYTWTTFNVTNAIAAKYAGFGWYGLELQADPEHLYSPDCAYDWGSADWDHAADTPYLTINFTPTSASAPPSIGFKDVGNQWAQPPLKDPVNVVTGGLKDSFTDIPAPAGVYGLDWSRTYNLYDAEQNVAAGGLGRGWSSSFFVTIAATTDGTGDETMTGPDGREVTWTSNSSGGFDRPFQYAADLSTVNGQYRVSFDDGSYWDFDGQGRLASMTSPNGQQQAVLAWNTSGQLVSVTASTTGQTPVVIGLLSFRYGADGRTGSVSLAKDSASPTVESVGYGYDTAGNLHTVTDLAGNVTTYGYDSSNRLASMTDPTGVVQMANTFNSSGQIATQKQPSGATTTFSYATSNSSTWTTSVHDSVTGSAGQATYFWQAPNNNKQVVQIQDNLPNSSGGTGNSATQTFGNSGSDTLGDLTSATSRLGGQNTLTYDGSNGVTCDAQPGGQCPAAGAALNTGTGQYTAYAYDTFGRILDKFINGQGDYVYAYNLDTDRLPSSMTDPTGAITTYTVVNGVVTSQTDPDGVVTASTYDDAGRVLTTTVDGATTSYTYDPAGRQTCEALPGGTCPDANGDGGAGSYTFTTYYPSGLVHTQRAADGGVTTYTYDTAGRTLTVLDPVGAMTANHYDPVTGLLTSTDSPSDRRLSCGLPCEGDPAYNVRTTHFAYDGNGNRTCVAPPGGTCPNSSGSGGVKPYELTTYGALGRVSSTTNELGQTTSYKYDADGNKGETDNPDGSVVNAAYDAAGHLYCTTTPGTPGQNNCPDLNGAGASGRYTVTRYDSFGRVSCVAQPGGSCTAATGPITTYTYDSVGREHTVTDANGGTAITTYTPAGRTDTVTDPDGGQTSYGYDSAGRTKSVTNPDGGITTTLYTAQGQVASTTSPGGLTTSHTYDAAGRVLTTTAPDGVVTTRTYTLRGELATQKVGSDGKVSYAYNGDGAVASVTDALGHSTSYSYDVRGNRIARRDAQGKSQTWSYDNADELVSQADQLNRTTTTTYYDDTINGHSTVLSDPSGRTTTTVYNPEGTIASTGYTGTAGNLTYSYGYDNLGHQTSVSDGTNTWGYTSNAAGELTAETTPAGAATSWTYDAATRRTTMTYPDGTKIDYTYYPSGLLRTQTLTRPGGQPQAGATYSYNADGQLTDVRLPDGSRSYTYGTTGTGAGKIVSYTQHLPGANQTAMLTYDINGRLASETVHTTAGGSGGGVSFLGVVGSAAANNAPHISTTLSSSVADGDLLLAVLGNNKGSPVTWTQPVGWPSVPDVEAAAGQYSNQMQALVNHRIASGDGGSSHTWSTSWANLVVGVLEYSGVDAAAPIDGSPSSAINTTTVPALTTDIAGSTLVYVLVLNGAGNNVVSAPAGFTQRFETASTSGTSDPHLYVFDATQAAAGDTGPVSATISGAASGAVAELIALRPAAGGSLVPGAPSGVSATAGDGQASVSWAAPVDNGGSAITGYTVTASPGGATATTTGATSATVTGLSDGTPYTFTVHATNAVGDSAESLASSSVTPLAGSAAAGLTLIGQSSGSTDLSGAALTTADVPAGDTVWAFLAASTGATLDHVSDPNGSYVVDDDHLAANGGAWCRLVEPADLPVGSSVAWAISGTAPMGWVFSLFTAPGGWEPDGVVPAWSTNISANTTSVSGSVPTAGDLVTAVATMFTSTTPVVSGVSSDWVLAGTDSVPHMAEGVADATNVGAGTASVVFSWTETHGETGLLIPYGPIATGSASVPGAPTAVTASPGDGSAVVSFSPPASDGGAAITGYTVTASPGGMTGNGSGSPIIVTGLTNGTPYTLTVAATNSAGTGPASAASAPATPTSVGGNSVTTTFGYDAAGQLVSQTPSNGPATTYTYDNLGHRATSTTAGVVTTYRYNDAGELCWTSAAPAVNANTCDSPPAGATDYAYDPAGRMLSSTTTTTNYGYDPAGRLGSIHLTDMSSGYDTTQTRGYNPDGDMTTLANTGTSTTSAALSWDDANSTPTLISPTIGGVSADLVQGAGQWAVADVDGTLAGIGIDVYGSVVPTDDTPGIAAATTYGAWGNTDAAAASLEPTLGYRGELQTGNLLDLRARNYDTALGAFTTVDPFDGVNGTTTIAGLYPYADNNPIANADPTGEQTADWNNFLTYVNQARAFVDIAPQLSQALCTSTGANNEPCLFDNSTEELANCASQAYDLFTGWTPDDYIQGTINEDCGGKVPLPLDLATLQRPGWLAELIGTTVLTLITAGAGPEIALEEIADDVGTSLTEYGEDLAADGGIGDGAGETEGKTVAVIGRLPDTNVAKDWAGHEVLDIPDWSIAKNDQWIRSVIDRKMPVYVGSPTTWDNLWDATAGRTTVFGRELQQLTNAGYTWDGWTMIPPGG